MNALAEVVGRRRQPSTKSDRRQPYWGSHGRGIFDMGQATRLTLKSNVCSYAAMSPTRRAFEDLERLRRSIAMLPPTAPALDREAALSLLAETQELRRDLDELERGLRRLVDRHDG